jgi:hypothetical protein
VHNVGKFQAEGKIGMLDILQKFYLFILYLYKTCSVALHVEHTLRAIFVL